MDKIRVQLATQKHNKMHHYFSAGFFIAATVAADLYKLRYSYIQLYVITSDTITLTTLDRRLASSGSDASKSSIYMSIHYTYVATATAI